MTIYIAGLESEHSAPIVVETKTLTMGAVSATKGTVAPAAGTHTYLKNIDAQIIALPKAGYLFAGWTGDAVDDADNAITTVKMDADKEVQANFILKRTLTISSTGGGMTSPDPGIYEKKDGDKVSISALANDGYEFKEWQGGSTSVKPDISVTMNADITVLAYFVKEETSVEPDIILYASTDTDDEGIDYNNGTEWVPVATMNHNRLSNRGTNTHAQIDSHIGSTSNPHSVTAAQAGALAKQSGSALPTAAAAYRGQFFTDEGSPDVLYWCRSTDGGTTYEWKENTHAQIDSHIGSTNNPHSVTSAQAGALAKQSGALPTASAAYRGQFFTDEGSPDVLYWCRSTDGGTTYEWKQVTLT